MNSARRIGIALLYAAALAGGSYLAFRPTFDTGFARVVGDPGDTMLNHYLLEHSRRALFDPDYRGTLLSPPFFHPTPLVLGYSENLLGVAPLYWGLRLFLPEVPAFQVWMIVLSGLNLVAFAAVARWLGAGPVVALLGGYLWAFGLIQIDQVKHAQMIPRFWMPLAVYHAWGFVAGANLRSLNRLCACVFLQCLTCVYTGWFLAVGVLVFVPVAAVVRPGGVKELAGFLRHSPRAWLIVGAWVAALGLFFVPYFLANRGVSRNYDDCVAGMPTLHSWLTAPDGGRWSETLRPYLPEVYGESRLFCGFALYGLMLAAAVWAYTSVRDPNRRQEAALVAALLLTAGFWWVVTLRFGTELSGWWVVRFVPGGQAIRCTSRVYVLVYLFGTLAAMLWFCGALGRIGNQSLRTAVLALVFAVVVFEQTGHEPISFRTDEFYPVADRCAESMAGADAGYVLPDYGPIPGTHGELVGMWAGLKANVPVVNGYSGRWPDGFPKGYEMNERLLREWLGGRFRGRVAVIDPHHPEVVRVVVIE
jgi:hypothetical protein